MILACGEGATPTPTATPTATPLAKAVPTGTLDMGISGQRPSIWGVPAAEVYFSARYDALTFGELPFWWAGGSDEIIPRLIKDWSVATGSDGNAVYTFNVQEGVPYHKQFGDWGTVDADDIKFYYESIGAEGSVNSKAGTARRVFLCDGCELTATDELTLQLKRPVRTFEVNILVWSDAGGIKPREHVLAVGEDTAKKQPVGTGPWELVEDKANQFRKMRAVRDHWRKTPEWDEFIVWEFVEESTRLANFLAGLLDTGLYSAENIQAIKSERDPDIKFITLESGLNHRL